jgi:hypothetical protein
MADAALLPVALSEIDGAGTLPADAYFCYRKR